MGNNHDTTAGAQRQVVESVTEGPDRGPAEPCVRREPAR